MTNRPVKAVKAVRLCCATGHPHGVEFFSEAWTGAHILPNVMASIAYCDERAGAPFIAASMRCENNQCKIHELGKSYGKRFAAAADRLRDFATVELLCEDLGITRKDLN